MATRVKYSVDGLALGSVARFFRVFDSARRWASDCRAVAAAVGSGGRSLAHSSSFVFLNSD